MAGMQFETESKKFFTPTALIVSWDGQERNTQKDDGKKTNSDSEKEKKMQRE